MTDKNLSEETRLYTAMVGLIYPSFLGALIYEGLPKLLTLLTSSKVSGSAGFLIVALIILYSYDYIYTVRDNKKGYGGPSRWRKVLIYYVELKNNHGAHAPRDFSSAMNKNPGNQ